MQDLEMHSDTHITRTESVSLENLLLHYAAATACSKRAWDLAAASG